MPYCDDCLRQDVLCPNEKTFFSYFYGLHYPGSLKLSLTAQQYGHIYSHVKTTIELPDAIWERTKVAAARRRTSMKNLVIQGLEMVLQDEVAPVQPIEALARLREGYHLGGRPMTREEIHAR